MATASRRGGLSGEYHHYTLYIYRQNADSLWLCAVPFLDDKDKKKVRRRAFSDRKYGSKSSSLLAAQQWRDVQINRKEVAIAMGDQRPLQLFTDVSDANPFGLVGVRPVFRATPLGGNISVTAQRGRKRWFSMRRHGDWSAFELAVAWRCDRIGVAMPEESELRTRFGRWLESNNHTLEAYGLNVPALD